jgi:hypothetical protein
LSHHNGGIIFEWDDRCALAAAYAFGVAAGELSEEELADWFRGHIAPCAAEVNRDGAR